VFKQPVVLVVGAGASAEYDFPLGSGLKQTIAEAVRFRFAHGNQLIGGDHDLYGHILRHVGGDLQRTNPYSIGGNTLANAAASFVSIDEALHFVSGIPEAVEVGKIAIVQAILEAERNSSLKTDPQKGRPTVAGGWIGAMFSMAMAGLRREEISSAFKNVTFVNFNYDRAIEQYLYWILQEQTGATPEQAIQIVAQLNMIRPYGSIGQFSPNYSDQFGFGTSAYFDPFSRLSNLGTYTDQKPMHDASAMHQALGAAALVIFLGFGYHVSNLDVMKLAGGYRSAAVLGTVKGIHQANVGLIADRITANLLLSSASNVTTFSMTALELLTELRPRILMLVG
jgi:hypothetical protein